MKTRWSTNLWDGRLSLASWRAAADLSKSSNREQHGVLDANHDELWCNAELRCCCWRRRESERVIPRTGGWSLAYIGLLGVAIKHMFRSTSVSIHLLFFRVISRYSTIVYFHRRQRKSFPGGQQARTDCLLALPRAVRILPPMLFLAGQTKGQASA